MNNNDNNNNNSNDNNNNNDECPSPINVKRYILIRLKISKMYHEMIPLTLVRNDPSKTLGPPSPTIPGVVP